MRTRWGIAIGCATALVGLAGCGDEDDGLATLGRGERLVASEDDVRAVAAAYNAVYLTDAEAACDLVAPTAREEMLRRGRQTCEEVLGGYVEAVAENVPDRVVDAAARAKVREVVLSDRVATATLEALPDGIVKRDGPLEPYLAALIDPNRRIELVHGNLEPLEERFERGAPEPPPQVEAGDVPSVVAEHGYWMIALGTKY